MAIDFWVAGIEKHLDDKSMLRVYSYKGCDSCRKALKWLKERNIEFENLAIRETPPKRDELAKMLSYKFSTAQCESQ